jgi:hypothetical protein
MKPLLAVASVLVSGLARAADGAKLNALRDRKGRRARPAQPSQRPTPLRVRFGKILDEGQQLGRKFAEPAEPGYRAAKE